MIQIVRKRGGFVHCAPKPITAPSIIEVFSTFDTVILPQTPEEEHVNLFYTLGHHTGAGEDHSKPARTAATFDHQTVLGWDIDGADATRWEAYTDALAGIFNIPSTGFIVVGSGNGLHLIVSLKYKINNIKYFAENKAAYKEICFKLGARMAAADLPGKVDPVIFEPARVLRLPGTKNIKENKRDSFCELLQMSRDEFDVNMKESSGLAKAELENITPVEIKRQYPQPDLAEMMKECAFAQWCLDKVEEVHEPHAFDLFSLLVSMPPDATIIHGGNSLTAKDIAKEVFENASASHSLAGSIFEDKWTNAGRYGCRKCTTIDDHWGRCKECKHFAKVPTPLALKSADHIGSEPLGFWVLNARGGYMNPHYGDLAKVFKRERTFVTTEDERIFTFNNKYYEELSPILIKRWMETKVVPNDPIKENMRVEMVKKLLTSGAMTKKVSSDLFDNSTSGRLNFQNGVLDIATGELLQHAPTFGFKYVLPYEYKPNQASEYFIDWLAQVLQDSTDLIELVLDVMAYSIWPNFDDHVMTYLVGDGSNGKSTLINVLRWLVGKDNYSTVSMQQLTQNRFAPADLEGKIVNLSEESGGAELTGEQLNTVKNLSSGGEMYIERKGQQGYTVRNKAKMLFSANKPPKFSETGIAVTRRLLTIPFKYTISRPDPSVEDRLKEEATDIMSMLITRMQRNVLNNNGKFMINRDLREVDEEKTRFLTATNTTVQWAKDRLLLGPKVKNDDIVSVDESFANYLDWCDSNGIKTSSNKIQFSKNLHDFVLPKYNSQVTQKCLKQPDGKWKTVRVITRARLE